MTTRVVEITSAARLSLRHGQLAIMREDGTSPTVPVEDLALLVTDNPQITFTHAALVAIAGAKAVTILCGPDHMPAAAILPFVANVLSGERQRAQLACGKPLAKRLWQAIVRAKLCRQADLLRRATGSDAGIAALAARLRSGDPENFEAQGARRYWPRLLGRDFRRDRNGPEPNHLLNYGYAILRAAAARAVVAGGLLPGIGLFHANSADAFALASDLMEPYRPFLDAIVWELCQAGMASASLDRAIKAHLLAVLNLGVAIDGQTMPLSLALQRSAASLATSFLERKPLIRLPEGKAGLPEEERNAASPAPS